ADELKLDKDHILLVVAEPEAGGGLSSTLRSFWDDATYKNRVLFLTGEREVIDRLLERSAELKAIRGIIDELEREKTPDTDPQLVGARELRDKILLQLLSAAKEGFDHLYYPMRDGLASADFLMNYQGNNYNGEAQIRETLKSKQKFTEDIDSDTFRKKCEQRLFTQQVMDFSEVKRRSATNPQWQWHLPNALDALKQRMLMEDAWRENGGLIDKGPFPPPVTSVRPQELRRDDSTGEVMLRLVPVHGDKVHYEIGAPATSGSSLVPDLQKFTTSELRLSFLAVDSKGEHQTGAAYEWRNRITLKHRFFQNGDQRMCELQAAPEVPIYYSTDGSTPTDASGLYDEPFPVPSGTICVLALGEKDGIRSEILRADVPASSQAVAVDPSKPATWKRSHSFDTTKETYEFLSQLEKAGASMLGMRVLVGTSPWAEINTDSAMSLDRAAAEKLLIPLRELVGSGEVQLSCDALAFPSGQDLLDWVADRKTELKEQEVIQVVVRNDG
ncbi:MAG: chitobiase/beta-hexosaminidase C-terminal domain-containing protein, partial [Verrucomicrobiae bacterium]|nr:chitobiase/beta-hexosaminidase C-terminal domain-containing protein [Verrucomicrobiae bacterium]